jgi:predicted RNase H-like nuclease
LLPKIKQVDELLVRTPELASRVREVHAEVCFTLWNGEQPMRFSKSTSEGPIPDVR